MTSPSIVLGSPQWLIPAAILFAVGVAAVGDDADLVRQAFREQPAGPVRIGGRLDPPVDRQLDVKAFIAAEPDQQVVGVEGIPVRQESCQASAVVQGVVEVVPVEVKLDRRDADRPDNDSEQYLRLRPGQQPGGPNRLQGRPRAS